jgi:hypothetical protein
VFLKSAHVGTNGFELDVGVIGPDSDERPRVRATEVEIQMLVDRETSRSMIAMPFTGQLRLPAGPARDSRH